MKNDNRSFKVREFQQLSQSGSRSGSVGKYGPVTAVAEELPGGVMRVGKITFHPDHLLGKGCEGTFVYRYLHTALKAATPHCSFVSAPGANSTTGRWP